MDSLKMIKGSILSSEIYPDNDDDDDSANIRKDGTLETDGSIASGSASVSASGSGSGSGSGSDGQEVQALVARENKAVRGFRVLVLTVLIAAAVISAWLVYVSFKNKEYNAFIEEYKAISARLVDAFRNDVLHKLWIGESVASAATAMVKANRLQAPNITIPSFESLAHAYIKLAPVKSIKWSPLLMNEQEQRSFIAYVLEQQHLLNGTVDEDKGEVEDGQDIEENGHNDNDPTKRMMMRRFLQATSPSTTALSSPVWQVAPSFSQGTNAQLYDLMADPVFLPSMNAMIQTRGPVMTQVYVLGEIKEHDEDDESEDQEENERDQGESQPGESHNGEVYEQEGNNEADEDKVNEGQAKADHSSRKKNRRRRLDDSEDDSGDEGEDAGDGLERAMTMLFPVFDDDENLDAARLVGSVALDFSWVDYLSGYLLLDEGETLDYAENIFDTDEVLVVLANTCGQTYSLRVDEGSLVIIGEGDLHDPNFDHLFYATSFEEFDADYASFGTRPEETYADESHCRYRFLIYPTLDIWQEHHTNESLLFAFVVALIFVFTSTIFLCYDYIVARRQRIIFQRAIQTNAIVASFFPDAVRKRMMERGQDGKNAFARGVTRNGDGGVSSFAMSDPIADFFPECTILFADIAGFTAWSSEREPTQVFKLLERTFAEFDRMAKKLGVFKVETIGDCYVAVVGLPTPRADHAVVCARFARAIVHQMDNICKELEHTLGPSTADLDIRVGLHSGPCTAGVLRGEKSRFQLFGDTMNTCSRLESTGMAGKIHVSETTAALLKKAGKEHWLIFRKDTPEIKGKGRLATFWLRTKDKDPDATPGAHSSKEIRESSTALNGDLESKTVSMRQKRDHSAKVQRLSQWNFEILSKLLQKVVAHRTSKNPGNKDAAHSVALKNLAEHTGHMLEEVKDVLALPQFDSTAMDKHFDPNSITLSPAVLSQLKAFVDKLASMYQDNPFHNFEHASHVTMSVTKLLSRIVAPTDLLSKTGKVEKTASDMHDHTFGITSDPLTQFAVVLSALVHDVDHPGVTNAVLVEEKSLLAVKYGRSIAEQNSVDLTLELLMEPYNDELRACIYTDEDEFNRFRSTIITLVLATDIMDKELGDLRKARWAKAFSGAGGTVSAELEEARVGINRKATIVLEHLIQASDVAHTMQHWHVFRKWNERLFQEMYKAYLTGRMDKDPSEGWYQGEIGFFDFYIIPLAKKLETCGVFGVSSHEYLAYAEANRHEWVLKGERLVEEYLERLPDNIRASSSSNSSGRKRDAIAEQSRAENAERAPVASAGPATTKSLGTLESDSSDASIAETVVSKAEVMIGKDRVPTQVWV